MLIFEKLKKNKSHAIYILLILLITIFYFFHFFNYNMPAFDISSHYLPMTFTLQESLFKYGDPWPLWTPYAFSGTPFLMLPELGIDSEVGLLTILLRDPVLATKMSYVLMLLIAGISMYSLMIYFKIEKKFAFLSAIVFMLNGHVTTKLLAWNWLTTLGGYAILPLTFLFGTKALKDKNWVKYAIITGIIFAIQLRVGTDMKVGLWNGFFFGIYILYNLFLSKLKWSSRLIKFSLITLIILIVFLGLSAQRILPNNETIDVSSRGKTSWQAASGRQLKYSNMFNQLIEPLTLKRYPFHQLSDTTSDHIGIVAFLLVIFCILKKFTNKKVLFFSLTALLSIFISSNTFGLYYLLWKYVPLFDSLRYMNRSLWMFTFSGSILAGFGSQALVKKFKDNKKKIFSIAIIVLVLLNLWIFGFHYNQKTDSENKDVWLDVYGVLDKAEIYNYLRDQPGIFRIQNYEVHGLQWGIGFYTAPNKLEHLYRYTGIWFPPYMNMYLGAAFRDIDKFFGMLNVKYLTAQTEINESGFKLVKKFDYCDFCYQEPGAFGTILGPYLYENKYFIPRAYVVENAVLVVGEENSVTQTMYGLMLNPSFDPKKSVIIRGKESISDYNINDLNKFSAIVLTQGSVDQNSGFILRNYVDSGGILLPNIVENENTITDEDLRNTFAAFKEDLNPIKDDNVITHNFDKKEVLLNEKHKGFLVLSEKYSFFPGWIVKSDKGKEILLNANVMNSAVYLGSNPNSLIFEYKPKSYRNGVIITSIVSILVIFYFIHRGISRRKKRNLQAQEP